MAFLMSVSLSKKKHTPKKGRTASPKKEHTQTKETHTIQSAGSRCLLNKQIKHGTIFKPKTSQTVESPLKKGTTTQATQTETTPFGAFLPFARPCLVVRGGGGVAPPGHQRGAALLEAQPPLGGPHLLRGQQLRGLELRARELTVIPMRGTESARLRVCVRSHFLVT